MIYGNNGRGCFSRKPANKKSGALALRINRLEGTTVNNMRNARFVCKLFSPQPILGMPLSYSNIRINGAGYKVRTRDPLITNQVLYQLS